MKKIYLFAISVMLLATSCGHKKEGDATLIRPVKIATASSQSVIRKDFSGIVEAVEYVKTGLPCQWTGHKSACGRRSAGKERTADRRH